MANCSSFVQLQGVASIVHDGAETVNSKWFAPEEVVSEFEQGKLYLAPPTWYLLKQMAKYNQLEQLIRHYSSTPMSVAQRPIQPNIVKPNKDQIEQQTAVFNQKNMEGLKDSLVIALPGDIFHHETMEGSNSLNRIEIGRVEGKMSYKHVTTFNEEEQPLSKM